MRESLVCYVTETVTQHCAFNRQPGMRRLCHNPAQSVAIQDNLCAIQDLGTISRTIPSRLQGWAERCEYESKERKAFFWSGAVGAASASHHGHGMLHLRVQVRRRNSISERHRSGRSAPSWALSPCTPMVGMIDWMGSASMRALPERAANARFGRGYQVLVRGHRPRALGTPVQAF